MQAGAGERTAALREVVHALQDQHFQLDRIRRLRGGADARIAATAAVEGYATLVTQHASAAADRRRTAVSRLKRFLELERGLVDSVGLRFEADLRDLGGTRAAIDSLRRFPATTEQVFHLDKYLQREPAAAIVLPAHAAGMTLARQGTFGELDVRALLAVFGVPRVDRAGSGWGGGRTARYAGAAGDAVASRSTGTRRSTRRSGPQAVTRYVHAAFDAVKPGPPATSACAATSCWQHRVGGRSRSTAPEGRTALVIGADLDRVEALARAITGRA